MNHSTAFIRQCVALYLAGVGEQFTTVQVIEGVKAKHDFGDHDVSKGVSNELQRLLKLGLYKSRPGVKGDDPSHVGRPPRVFRKVYCEQSLLVLRRRTVVDKGFD